PKVVCIPEMGAWLEKKVNDTYGHHAGDRALRAIAGILKENIRKSDSFGRWGGEEFMIAAPGISKEETLALAEKVRSLIERYVFESAGQITISCGISYLIKDDTLDSLTMRADDALYRAKNGGRNKIESDNG
ncbi:MAG TPA: GGDEF domain-containing protein, partial [Dissulfurispiraceae bacterium]